MVCNRADEDGSDDLTNGSNVGDHLVTVGN